MEGTLYYNKSDKRYLHKQLDQIGNALTIELIEPSSIINPSFILSNESRVREANYIFIPDLGRYYYIEDYIFEYERIIINCKVDVLMSFKDYIANLEIITERTSHKGQQNLFLPDNKIKEYSYPFIEVHKLKCTSNNGFSQDNVNYILGISGAVLGGSNEGGE